MARSSRAVRAASEILGTFDPVDLPVDVDEIAKGLDVQVRYEPMDDVSGATYRGPSSVRVVVNSTQAAVRQRFTLAHELGHVVLHTGRQLVVDPRVRVSYRDALSSLATDTEEIEANSFAATLLMPEDKVRAAISAVEEIQAPSKVDATAVVTELAGTFGVSVEAMAYRLANLGILSIS